MKLSYFEQRAANNQWDSYNTTEYNLDKVIKAYERTSKQIINELMKIDKEIEEKGLSRSVVYRVKYLKQLENYYLGELSKLGKSIEKIYTENLNKAAEKSYSDTSDELKIPIVYNKNNTKRIMQIPWYGATFSNRIWKNQAKLIKELSTVIETGINTGKTPIQMTLDLQNKLNSDLSKTMRLVRTETMHHLNQIKLQSYKDSKVVKQLKDVVTLDDRTSEQCAVCAGRIYDIDKAPSLPRHVNCRCVLVPYIDVNKLSKEFDDEEVEISKKELQEDISVFWKDYDKLTEKVSKDKILTYFKESYIIGKLPDLEPFENVNNKQVDITGERLSYIFNKHYKEFNKEEFELIYELVDNPDYIAKNYSDNSLLIYKKIPEKDKRLMEGVIVFDEKNTVIHFHKINSRKLKKLEREDKILFTNK